MRQHTLKAGGQWHKSSSGEWHLRRGGAHKGARYVGTTHVHGLVCGMWVIKSGDVIAQALNTAPRRKSKK